MTYNEKVKLIKAMIRKHYKIIFFIKKKLSLTKFKGVLNNFSITTLEAQNQHVLSTTSASIVNCVIVLPRIVIYLDLYNEENIYQRLTYNENLMAVTLHGVSFHLNLFTHSLRNHT